MHTHKHTHTSGYAFVCTKHSHGDNFDEPRPFHLSYGAAI